MSETEIRVRRHLHHIADQLNPDPTAALVEVQRRAQTARTQDRFRAVSAAVAVLLLVLVVSVVAAHRSRPPVPIGPPQPLPSDPFRVVRTLEPGALGLDHVLRVAISPRGYLVATDQSQRVAELTPSGRVLRSWGRPGTGPGEFRLQSGSIAVDNQGTIYVSDTGNSRIQVFSADGQYIRSIGSYGSSAGHVIGPRDLTVDTFGNLYVADDTTSTLTKFSSTGRQLWRLENATSTDPDLYGHFHFVGLDSTGDLVAANDDAGRVIWIRPDGRKRSGFGSGKSSFRTGGAALAVGEFPHGACGASMDAWNRLYVVSCQDASDPRHQLEVFDPRHHEIANLTTTALFTMPVFLDNNTAMFVDYRGSIVEAQIDVPNKP